MTIKDRIAHHSDIVASCQRRHAERIKHLKDDLDHRPELLDSADLMTHARILDGIEQQIAREKAIIQELQILDAMRFDPVLDRETTEAATPAIAPPTTRRRKKL